MHRTRKLAMPVAVLAVGGLLAAAPPAQAANANLDCEPGRAVFCYLDNASSGEYWIVNGTHNSAGDGRAFLNISCQPGHAVVVSVSYTNTLGVADSASGGAACLTYNP